MSPIEQAALLSTAYLGSVRYFSKYVLHSRVEIEAHENYLKQSYRNRCTILSANGPFSLSIPVKYSNHPKTGIRDVLIDYDTPWHKIHWQAIVSAYRNSPFFEYFADDLHPFYSGKHTHLFNFNNALDQWLLKTIGIDHFPQFTQAWKQEPAEAMDYRSAIHPKPLHNKPDPSFRPIVYTQVFQTKFGFVPDLSIIDLLFNAGTETLSILEQSVIKNPG